MKFLWCDTETTGLEPGRAAPFQIGFIFVSTVDGAREETERCFLLNPFDIPGVEYSEDAGKINGYSREAIEGMEKSESAVPKIAAFLEDCMSFRAREKMFFAGYNGEFDWSMLVWLFSHYGLDFGRYFQERRLDVFEQVKDAGRRRVLPYLKDRKLATVAEHLNISLENAHDALADIRATREVAKSLARSGVALK